MRATARCFTPSRRVPPTGCGATRPDGSGPAAGDGVHCLSPEGELLGRILTGGTVANLTFGGRNRSRLFLCAAHALMAIYTNVRGAQRP